MHFSKNCVHICRYQILRIIPEMSRVVRRKHVLRERMEDDFELPTEQQQIVCVACSRGNNLHEVIPAEGEENFLVSMPNKFRRNLWVKRGDYLLVEPIAEGDKVKAEIYKVLTPEHVKEFTKAGIWPKRFTKKREIEKDSQSDDGDLLVRNYNRPVTVLDTDESSSEDVD